MIYPDISYKYEKSEGGGGATQIIKKNKKIKNL